jgi:ammonia channel protein AmtB
MKARGVAFLAVWIFQFAFADTCSTITSGAMIGRTGFVGDLLYSMGVTDSYTRSSDTGLGDRMAGWL